MHALAASWRIGAPVGLVVLAALSLSLSASGQPGAPFDFRDWADPEQFFARFFTQDAEAERRALEQITISAAEEARYGGRAADAYLNELRKQRIAVTRRSRDIAYLQRLTRSVQPQMAHGDRYQAWRIYIAESEEIEAKCFPGGTLIFFRGLLASAPSEAAVIGAIGHELSHLDHGHQLQWLRRLKLAEQTFAGRAGPAAPPAMLLQNGLVLMKACLRPFRPEDEAVADRDAAAWAFRLGYDPREFAELFRLIQGRGPRPGDRLPDFLRTHPPPDDRHRAVARTYQELMAEHPAAALYRGRENLRQRIPREEREFPE